MRFEDGNPKTPDFDVKIKNNSITMYDLDKGSISLTNGIETAINLIKEHYLQDDIIKYEIGYYDSDNDFCLVIPIWENNICVDVKFIHPL